MPPYFSGPSLISDNSLIKNVKIFDQFLNEKNKSIAIEITIQPIDHTLTDHELEDISLKVINSVESATKGKLRSQFYNNFVIYLH